MELLKSAAKVVFILMALAVTAGLFLGKIDAKDFMVLAAMAFTFYFTAPRTGDPNQPLGGK